jgi:Zn-dependent protease
MIIRNLFIGLLVILLHEVGHLTAALALGINVKRIGVSWKGIYIVREAGPALANMITTLAGPLLNLLLAFAWPASHVSTSVFTSLNLIFGLTNLMPISGSDGQRAFTLLAKEFRQRAI